MNLSLLCDMKLCCFLNLNFDDVPQQYALICLMYVSPLDILGCYNMALI